MARWILSLLMLLGSFAFIAGCSARGEVDADDDDLEVKGDVDADDDGLDIDADVDVD